jgi:hypothetical protein
VIASASPAGAATPAGYTVAHGGPVAPGLDHLTMIRSAPAQTVHVARYRAGGEYALRAVVSNDAVGTGLERTSAMCARVKCLVAVNGDFAAPGGEPIGGVMSLGELVRTPSESHHQLVVAPDGSVSAGGLRTSAALVSTDLRRMDITAVNLPRGQNQLLLYTPAWGPHTATNPHGVEVAGRIVKPSGTTIRAGQTAVVRLTGIRDGHGSTPIPGDGIVLSGHGAGAITLRDLWRRTEASRDVLLRIDTAVPAAESVGGTPILVKDGKRWFNETGTTFSQARHPRTLAGRTASGETLLVTVDGRQPGVADGMTLAEAADLMLGLGAVEAINLDGGGSTTFVVKGAVVNRPSDRAVRRRNQTAVVHTVRPGEAVVGHVERPVSVALAIVPRSVANIPAAPLAGPVDLSLPQALPSIPVDSDPASLPNASIPVLVPSTVNESGRSAVLAFFATIILLLTALIVRRPVVVVGDTPAGRLIRTSTQRLRTLTTGAWTCVERGSSPLVAVRLEGTALAGAVRAGTAAGSNTGVPDEDGSVIDTSGTPPEASPTTSSSGSTATAPDSNGT